MGRVFIELGEPSQRQKLLGLQKITPMEIWFYSNGNPALPPFFYVVFYQRDPSSEFRLYSPYSDGPEAVVATGERLRAEGAEAVLLDCIGFTERHRDTLAVLDMPVILSNAVVAKAVGELFGG